MVFYRYDVAVYRPGDTIFIADGRHVQTVTRYTVKRITPSGQLVAELRPGVEIRIGKTGRIAGESSWSARCVVGPEKAREIEADLADKRLWHAISKAAESVDLAARRRDEEAFAVAEAALRQAIEARRAETAKTGSVHESAVRDSGDAQAPSSTGAGQ